MTRGQFSRAAASSAPRARAPATITPTPKLSQAMKGLSTQRPVKTGRASFAGLRVDSITIMEYIPF
jgi:hypothetical protein